MRAAPWIIASALSLASASAAAHPSEEGTARITLRDEHIEVVVEWDLFLLVERSPTDVATSSADALAREHQALVRRIEAQTRLFVDETPVPLALRGAPGPDELRAIAAQLSADSLTHGARVRMRLEARGAHPSAHRVSFVAPSALGPVIVSFVQPASRYALAGTRSTFDVLERPQPVARAALSSPPRDRTPWLVGAAVTLALATTLGASRSISRRARSEP
ncbi:MAG: hypothetical protein U0269_20370 [Polyangiales bacterium]